MAGVADMDREDVKAAIRKRGMTLTALAVLNDYTDSAVRKALSTPWPAVEKIIADFLNKKPGEIWPSRYLKDGTTPRPAPRSKRDNKHRRRRRHRQKRA